MERVLKFRDNQHEEDRVTKLHSGGHQTDSGIEQNDEYGDESDEETTAQNGLSRKAKKEIEKRRRRRAKKKTKSIPPPPPSQPPSEPSRKETRKTDDKKKKKKYESDDDDDDDINDPNVEIEYIQEDIPVKRGDGYYSHFVKVFENFKLDQNGNDNAEYYYNKYGKKVLAPKPLLPRDKTNIDENEEEEDDEKETNNHDKKKKDGDDDEQNSKKSKKQMKRETRLSVAQLKQLVIRPDVVEMFDVTAKDPKLLVHLKVNHFLSFP
jgi:splicing factor 3B subunit 2